MIKKIVTSRDYVNLNDQHITIKYYLTELFSKSSNSAVYGIAVEEYIKNGSRYILNDNDQEAKLSYSCSKITDIIQKLADNIVSPVTFPNILDELLE